MNCDLEILGRGCGGVIDFGDGRFQFGEFLFERINAGRLLFQRHESLLIFLQNFYLMSEFLDGADAGREDAIVIDV
jgi:hypothetical protein